MLDALTKEQLAPHLGSRFTIDLGAAGRLELELAELTPFPPAGAGARPQPFSALFVGPRDAILPQRIYRLEHPVLGALEIFIVPVGPDARGMRYEAVFN